MTINERKIRRTNWGRENGHAVLQGLINILIAELIAQVLASACIFSD